MCACVRVCEVCLAYPVYALCLCVSCGGIGIVTEFMYPALVFGYAWVVLDCAGLCCVGMFFAVLYDMLCGAVRYAVRCAVVCCCSVVGYGQLPVLRAVLIFVSRQMRQCCKACRESDMSAVLTAPAPPTLFWPSVLSFSVFYARCRGGRCPLSNKGHARD